MTYLFLAKISNIAVRPVCLTIAFLNFLWLCLGSHNTWLMLEKDCGLA